MSTITKEWLQQKIADMEAARDEIPFGMDEDDSKTLAAMKLALASLEAEAVAWRNKDSGHCGTVLIQGKSPIDCGYEPLYLAPPAPVSVPDITALDNLAGEMLNHAMNCERRVSVAYTHCAHRLAEEVRDLRAAMLQGDEQPQSAQQNIPEIIPGGLVEAVNNLLNNDGSRGRYSAIGCGEAREKIELWLAQRQKWESQRSEKLFAGNSPVIPDGWVLVPVEPTEDMIVNGFESEPDESFSDEKEWATYDAMSGCQQAAHRAKLCWAAMIAASPAYKKS